MEEQNNENQPVVIDETAFPSALNVAAIQVHEMYLAFQKSGFTKEEALDLVGFIAGASGIMEPNRYDALDDELGDNPKHKKDFFDEDDEDFGDSLF
jgi:hypothetical protein